MNLVAASQCSQRICLLVLGGWGKKKYLAVEIFGHASGLRAAICNTGGVFWWVFPTGFFFFAFVVGTRGLAWLGYYHYSLLIESCLQPLLQFFACTSSQPLESMIYPSILPLFPLPSPISYLLSSNIQQRFNVQINPPPFLPISPLIHLLTNRSLHFSPHSFIHILG